MKEIITCGIDAGLETLKIALLQRDTLIYSNVNPIEANATADIADAALKEAITAAGLTAGDLSGTFATGVGAQDIPIIDKGLPDALCLATGINYMNPSFNGVVLDIGAHKSIAVQCKGGFPVKAAYNDRCASGSGLFLGLVAQLLGLNISDIGALALQSTESVTMQSTCAIYAETEIISLLHNRKRPEDILKSVFTSIAARAYPLAINCGFIPGKSNLAVAGGIAHNVGVMQALEERIAAGVWVPESPDIPGALGAALLGQRELKK